MEECKNIPYIIDLEKLEGLKKPRLAVLQVPPGVRQYSSVIAECVSRKLGGAPVYVQLDPIFGACDLAYPQLSMIAGADLIVHVGHTPYPPELASSAVMPKGEKPRIVFLKLLSKSLPSDEALEEAIDLLLKYNAESVALSGTAQHIHIMGDIAGKLEERGLKPILPPGKPPYFMEGQVIGCEYSTALRVGDKADAYLYVGGGLFHPLGLYLAVRKPVVQLDPYSSRPRDVTPEGEKTLKKRMYQVMRAMDAKNFAIIVGLKTGQYRPWLVKRLAGLIERKGGKYRVYLSDRLMKEDLASLPAEHDAVIITSCPRLPIDDYPGFDKPVLTPGEAVMALTGRLEPYRFPW